MPSVEIVTAAQQSTPQRPIDSGFGVTSTAADVLSGLDLTGRLAIVTGGYSGLGLEATRALTAAGSHVLVPARRPEVAAGTSRASPTPTASSRTSSISPTSTPSRPSRGGSSTPGAASTC
jgi:hypothetical protein